MKKRVPMQATALVLVILLIGILGCTQASATSTPSPTATAIPSPTATVPVLPTATPTPEPFFLLVTEPQGDSIVNSSPITVIGSTTPDAVVSINGESAEVDIDGAFSAEVIIEEGPNVIEVAYKYFFLPHSPRLEVIKEDGRKFIDGSKNRFDLIFQDAFHANGVSRHLESVTYFQNVREHLNPGGWLINNVWGSDRANLNLIRQNLTGIFPRLYALSVRAESNVIFFAGESEIAPLPAAMKECAARLSQDTGIDFSRFELNMKTIRAGGNERMRIIG